ncbi:hypothetical protein FOZ62_005038 [Perkinsus olseni]|uniref:Uncharacterized protein n=1 Tax=Perkinsus olseni TaxID=32597 RepID=A0A7J6Q849_PEROL|nr:hypothetical protein FOZ62_005038 [Perkinsus olseni]
MTHPLLLSKRGLSVLLLARSIFASKIQAKRLAGHYTSREEIRGLGDLQHSKAHVRESLDAEGLLSFHVTMINDAGLGFEMPRYAVIKRYNGWREFTVKGVEGWTAVSSRKCYFAERAAWLSAYFSEVRQAMRIPHHAWVNPGYRLCPIGGSWVMFRGSDSPTSLTDPVKLKIDTTEDLGLPSPEPGYYHNGGNGSNPEYVSAIITSPQSRGRQLQLSMWSSKGPRKPSLQLPDLPLERSSGSCWHLQADHDRDRIEDLIKSAGHSGHSDDFGFMVTLEGIRLCPTAAPNGAVWLLKFLQPPRVIALVREELQTVYNFLREMLPPNFYSLLFLCLFRFLDDVACKWCPVDEEVPSFSVKDKAHQHRSRLASVSRVAVRGLANSSEAAKYDAAPFGPQGAGRTASKGGASWESDPRFQFSSPHELVSFAQAHKKLDQGRMPPKDWKLGPYAANKFFVSPSKDPSGFTMNVLILLAFIYSVSCLTPGESFYSRRRRLIRERIRQEYDLPVGWDDDIEGEEAPLTPSGWGTIDLVTSNAVGQKDEDEKVIVVARKRKQQP